MTSQKDVSAADLWGTLIYAMSLCRHVGSLLLLNLFWNYLGLKTWKWCFTRWFCQGCPYSVSHSHAHKRFRFITVFSTYEAGMRVGDVDNAVCALTISLRFSLFGGMHLSLLSQAYGKHLRHIVRTLRPFLSSSHVPLSDCSCHLLSR